MKARRRIIGSDPAEISARLAEIESAGMVLQEWINRWLPVSDESLTYYKLYEDSGCTLLPYPGGVVDQPAWILRDFDGWATLSSYYHLVNERDELMRRLAKHVG